MNQAVTQLDTSARPTDLARRCERLGVALLAVDLDGRVRMVGRGPQSIVHRAVVTSPMFLMQMRQIAAHWREQSRPSIVELWPGCWVLPIVRTERRRRVGYHVAVTLNSRFIRAEQFRHVCDHGRLDSITAARRLARIEPGSEREAANLAVMLDWMVADTEGLTRKTDEIDTLTRHLGETYEELSLVYKVSAHMTVTQDPGAFLKDVCTELHQVLALQWVALRLIDTDERMGDLRGRLIVSGDCVADQATLARVGRELIDCLGQSEPIVVADTSCVESCDLASLTRQAMVVPIRVEGRCVGVLFTGGKSDEDDLSSIDSKLATAAGQNAGIFLENAMLYEDAQDMFMGTLHALIASIDAKDTYTCGHSERVAWLSRQLAAAAGLDEQTVQRTYLSALVHDVGKIGVPEAVLCKPGKLTDEEFVMIKAHPEIGARILRDIRQMRDLLPGVLHHHERYDGRGYPYGLAGEAIPLFGRLICLADSFDAMSSNRTYRSALSHEKVLSEIERCAGSQFDPALAGVFLKLDFTGFFDMLAEHQNRQTPLSQAMRSTP